MTNKINYKSLVALKAVFEQGSFIKGADAMHMTQSAISQRIKTLESHIGSPVITRTHKLELTKSGTLLINHINKVGDLEQDLNDKLPQLGLDQPSLKIAVNADSLSTWWFSAIEDISRKLDIRFDIVVADQDTAISKMSDGEVLACLCSSKDSLSGATAIKVHTMNYRMYASKEFYQQYFANTSLTKAIETAPAILYGRDDHLHDRYLAMLDYSDAYPYHNVPDAGGLAQAIISGMGYGMLTDEQLADKPNTSDLVNIAKDYCLKNDLYWHYWHNSSDTLTKFSNSLG
jgi:LysR family transcriptional regulator (chromosome initiation inhibitor)